jgi:PAS domain S-box-containing protein
MNQHASDSSPADRRGTPVGRPLSESEGSARSTLDALSAQVAILDETGKIVAANRAWRSFADANQPVLVGMLEGANYLELFASADGAGAEHAAAIVAGVEAVMRGDRQEFVFESSCRSLREKRWFNARVTRFSGDGPLRIVVAHEDVTERKRAEEALRTSETRYRAIFESSCDAMMTLAPPSWRFASGNPATIAMFGARDEADFVSRAPWQYSPPRQPDGRRSDEKALEMIETAVRDGSHFFEWEHTRIDGTVFPATVLLTRVDLAGEMIVQATVRDIAEQKLLEEEKERATREIRDLYEKAPCGYHSVDVNGVYVRINDTELSWLGYPREQLVGEKKFSDFLTARSLETYKRNFSVLLERGCVTDVECELIRADGTTLPVLVNATAVKDAAGRFLMSRCVLLDITARKRAEAALRESRETVRSHIEGAFDVIFSLNDRHELVFVSPAWESCLGHPTHKVIGKLFASFMHPDDVASFVEHLTRVLASGQGETTPPYRMKHAKGEWRCFVANVRPHVDRKGETQFIGLAMLLPTAPAGEG